jgi:hypothetical protein
VTTTLTSFVCSPLLPFSDDEASPEAIAAALRAGRIPADGAFDRHLPSELAQASSEFWTPLAVAVRAGSWFRKAGVRTVVDIGAGVGKFCVAAALAGDCVCLGIEHRSELVSVAESLAQRFGCEGRVGFIEGAFGDVCIGGADAFYLYNPFGENLCDHGECLDRTVALGVTYNGFGGRMPSSFSETEQDRTFPNALRMWRKEAATTTRRRG